jgi:hypothetical protein
MLALKSERNTIGRKTEERIPSSSPIDIRKVYQSKGLKGTKGYSSYRITLPIEWIKESGLESGGWVKITINDDGQLCFEKVD